MAEDFDVGSRHVDGGYFLPADPRGMRRSPPRPGQTATRDQLVWTREGESTSLKDALLEMIHDAQRKVFIASFRIGDPELFEELFDAVERLRGSVYVITLVDAKSLAKGIAEEDEGAGADEQALSKQFGPLVERGLYVRGHESCHAKFVIVDDEVALVSSANLEPRALAKTTEIGVVTRDRGEVGRLARLFTRLWHECPWEVAPSTTYTVAERAKTAPPFSSIPEPQGPQHAIWTHHGTHQILDAARATIRDAQRELLLASFSLNKMAANPDLLLSSVERFRKEKAGRVRLLVRSRNHIRVQRQDAEAFVALGCEVVADDVNHAKCVMADGKEALLFSANFDADHGLTSGVEAGIRLTEPALVEKAWGFFESLLHAAPTRFVVSPSHSDLQALATGWMQPWPESAVLRVRASDADWKALVEVERGRPVLFEQDTSGRLVIIAGRAVLFLQGNGGNEPWQLTRSPATGADSAVELERWLEAKRAPATARGFCAARFVRAD
jgi:hypothetical protein